MKKISFLLSAILLTCMCVTSCVKDRNVGPDFSSTDPVLELRTPISNIAGLANLSKAVIGILSDTVQFYANLASAYTMDHDINVTIGVDAARIDTYNGDSANALKYELLPDSAYSIIKTAGTIVKGQRIDSFQVAFFKDKIDPTINYMLPIAITDGSGILLSQNQSVIWFHAIGNPIAGAYFWDFKRWDAADSTSVPLSGLSFIGDGTTALFAPDDATTIEVPSGYFIQPRYVLTFDNNGGNLSNFDVSLNEDDVKAMADNGVTVIDGPNILIADPIAQVFEFQYTVLNTTPANRYIVDKYYR